MPTFELTVHTLRLLLAHEDVDAAFEGLNHDYIHAEKQNVSQVDERCSIQCELAHASKNLNSHDHCEPAAQCEEQTSPRSSVDGVRAASP